MKPTRCPVCQGDQMTTILLAGQHGFFVSFLDFRTLHAVACLDCGVVTRYLDDATIAKLRAQAAKSSKAKASTDEL
jgi:hypothetical protein